MNLAKRLPYFCCQNVSRFRLFCTITPIDKIRSSAESTNSTADFVLEKLNRRKLISLRGEPSKQFIQDLITNDICHLNQRSSIYAMFLHKNGRVLYDTIVYRTNLHDLLYIECSEEIAEPLKRHLLMYRIRKKIDIDIRDDLSVWIAFNRKGTLSDMPQDKLLLPPINQTDQLLVSQDPRLKNLGTRIIAPVNNLVSDLFPLYKFHQSPTGNEYKKHRYRLGVAEGFDEIPPMKCFPLEYNLDYLHGISFHKGCYLGQELTARTHYTGVIRKRIMPIEVISQFWSNPSEDIVSADGVKLGKLKGFCENYGIGLLKIEPTLKETEPMLLGGPTSTILGKSTKPFWWSVEAPTIQPKQKTNEQVEKAAKVETVDTTL